MELPYEIEQAHPEVQAHYRRMIEDGQTERFALMCSLQQAPSVAGDNDSWMRGRHNGQWLDQLPTKQAKWMLREAKAAGIDTTGKYYCSGIADSKAHLDGEAWVSSRDDVLRVAKKRQLELRGQINYTPPEGVAPPKRVPLNPKLVKKLAGEMMRRDPKLSKREAVEAVKSKHTPHWAKKSS
jgi:hypothetical protein